MFVLDIIISCLGSCMGRREHAPTHHGTAKSAVPKFHPHNNPQIVCDEIDRCRILSLSFPDEFEVIDLRRDYPKERHGSPIILLKYRGPNPSKVNEKVHERLKMLLNPLGYVMEVQKIKPHEPPYEPPHASECVVFSKPETTMGMSQKNFVGHKLSLRRIK
ncbi:hypothetical protein BJX96DRAFT_151990 [Aspergillus floccosus]